MEINNRYNVPFEDFDWRTTMFSTVNEFLRDSLIELVKKFKSIDQDFDWKDDQAIVQFALDNNLFEKAGKFAKEKAEDWIKDTYS